MKHFLWTKGKSSLFFFSQSELDNKWLDVNGWLGSCTRQASSKYCFHSYKMITDQAALLAVIGMNRRVTWQIQSFLIADNILNKAWLVLLKHTKCCSENSIFSKVSTCIAKTKKCWDDEEEDGNDFPCVQNKINSCSGTDQQYKGDEIELLMCPKHAWRGLNSF